MKSRMRRFATGLGAVAAGLVLFVGCGPEEKASAPGVATANTAAKTPPAPNTTSVAIATARVAKYWTVDRFVHDGLKPPVQYDPMFPLDDTHNPLIAKAPRDAYGELNVMGGPALSSDAYVWGLVRANGGDPSAGGDLWFGTVANTLCYAQQSILGYGLPPFPTEYMDGYWKCDFGMIGGEGTDLIPARYGDWRPPHIYRYDTEWTGAVEGLNALSTPVFGPVPPLYLMDPRIDGPNPPEMIVNAVALQNKTIGFRSAGTSRGVIFLAGPAIDDPFDPTDGSVILFAYRDSEPPEFLGATELVAYNNVRSWVTHGDELYVGVGVKAATAPYGAVLRWTGYMNPENPYDADTLFQFETVGVLETEAANLAIHNGQMYVTTWPYFASPNPANWMPIGLFRSPQIPEGGLTAANKDAWTKLWSISSYDPDFVAALATGGGALESFDGAIYWGTMHVPFAAGLVAFQLSDMYPGIFYGTVPINDVTVARVVNMMLGSHRSPAVFRGEDMATRKGGTKFQVTLVYGEKYLPKAVLPPRGDGIYRVDGTTAYATNSMPTDGASGFGNFFNAYIWSATNYAGQLWMGTFDWSQLARVGLQTIANTQPDPNSPQAVLAYRVAQLLLPVTGSIAPHEGADLYRFGPTFIDEQGKPKRPPAVAEDLTGLGNDTNYGFRTMATGPARRPGPIELQAASPVPKENLYIGTANAMNLHPRGGWELLQLPTPYRKPVCECPDDGFACTDDLCIDGKCVHPSNCPEGLMCSYDTGQCEGGQPACTDASECGDDDPCTDDICTEEGICSNPSNGSCVQHACTVETVETDCTPPTDPCSVAACNGGYCDVAKKCLYPETCVVVEGVGTCVLPEPN